VVAQKTLPGRFCAQNLPGSRTSGGQSGPTRNPGCDAQLTGSNPVSCLIGGVGTLDGVVEPHKQVMVRVIRRAVTLDMDAGSIPAHGSVSCLRAGYICLHVLKQRTTPTRCVENYRSVAHDY